MNSNHPNPADQLMRFILGRWVSKPLYAAARLGIADLLSAGPKNIETLSRETGTDRQALYRVLRALASVGIFRETESREFALTPMAGLLKSGALRSAALLFNAEWNDLAWMYFPECLKTGENAFRKAHGQPLSEWLPENPEAARIFDEANAVRTAANLPAITAACDFSGVQSVTDVGGGTGILLAGLLKANPRLRGMIADRPQILEKAEDLIEKQHLNDRCQTIACDFFEQIPAGSDRYLLSNILHNWRDESCQIILKNCRRAMKPDSRLLILEMIVPPGNQPSPAKLLDLEMMVVTGGRERTETEYRMLLQSSGFLHLRTTRTAAEISIIEAQPAAESRR